MLKTLLSSVAALITATALSAQCVPESSDATNNNAAGAEVGATGLQLNGNVASTTDEDFWSFAVTGAPVALTIKCCSRGVQQPASDLEIDLIDTNGVTVLDTFDLTIDDEITNVLPIDGTYYVNVRHETFGTYLGDYGVDLKVGPVNVIVDTCAGSITPFPSFTETEPNNDCSSTDVLAACSSRIETLQTAGDSDFFQVVGTGETYVFETISDTTLSSARSDTKLWIYDSACTLLDEDDDGGAGLLSRLEFFLNSGDVYYVEVSDWQRGNPGEYHIEVTTSFQTVPPGTEGSQELVSLLAPPTSGCGGVFATSGSQAIDDIEPNGTCAQAAGTNIVTLCQEVWGGVGTAGGVDFWEFVPPTTGTYTFETINDTTNLTTMSDTELWLYDSTSCSDPGWIGNNDDGGAGLYSLLEADLVGGNTYYIEVGAFNRGSGTGTFRLQVDQLSFGPTCVGSNGNLLQLELHEDESPEQGTTVSCSATAGAFTTATPAVMHIGFGAGGVNLVPIDLFIIGAPGCKLAVNPTIAAPIVFDANGDAEFCYSVGALPQGLPIHMQAAAIDFGAARPVPVTLSESRIVFTVGDASFQ